MPTTPTVHQAPSPEPGSARTQGTMASTCVCPSGNALDQAQAAFDALMSGPAPLMLNGTDLGSGFPAREIDLLELRALLLGHRTDLGDVDSAWSALVRRSRTYGQDWVLGCVGVALPGLKQIAARAARGVTGPDRDDVVSDLLTAFVDALASINLGRRAILTRLNWAARRAANRARLKAQREIARDPLRLNRPAAARQEGHVDIVLADMVICGVLSAFEARIITRTRLERHPCSQVAEQLGLSYEALMKRRRRAETRLAAHLEQRIRSA